MGLRCSIPIHQPNEFSLRVGLRSRQIGPGQHSAEDLSFAGSTDEKEHFACRCQSGKRQGHTRDQRFEAGFRHPDDPPFFFLELLAAGEKRSGMPIWAESHQHQVEQRSARSERFCAVKIAKVHFIEERGLVHVSGACWYRVNVAGRDGNTIKQQPPCRSEITPRVIIRHEAVVSPEPVDALPGQRIAIMFGPGWSPRRGRRPGDRFVA
jgi:hypothetical protein